MTSSKEKYIPIEEAESLLGIKRKSVYSYVSRKKIRTVIDPKNHKKRLYSYDDIISLLEHKNASGIEKILQHTLTFGEPVLESSITLIEDSILYYRGYSIGDLVEKYSFEQVISLLWTGNFQNVPDFEKIAIKPLQNLPITLPDIQRYLLELEKREFLSMVWKDLPSIGWKILMAIIQDVTQNFDSNISIAEKLASFFCHGIDHASDIINTALIVIADHELNPSSFTARIVTSTGANLFQVIIAGLAALSGFKHGGAIYECNSMLLELQQNFQFDKNLQNRLRRGEDIVGFGHNLYEKGDYRAKVLLKKIEKYYGSTKEFEIDKSLIDKLKAVKKQEPTIDCVLLILSKVLGNGTEFALFLFAYGRLAGWIGHVIEESKRGKLIRPRAKYIGPMPTKK